MLWLDPYERRARLAPGLLALLPLAVAITAFGLRELTVVTSSVALLSAAGGPVLLANYVRNAGLRVQDRLWSQWGGAPTTAALRLRESSANTLQRFLWREAVMNVTGVNLLADEAEKADPAFADDAIEAAVACLRGMTRGDQFPLVGTENKNYGFQRNLYGLRWVGRATGGVTCIALSFALWTQFQNGGNTHLPVDLALGLGTNLCLLAIWIMLPSATRVRAAAEKYAQELLHAAITLAKNVAITSKTKDI